MISTGNHIVDQIGQMHFQGNVIPAAWYKSITFSDGKPNMVAIILLSEIVYWYRPTEIRDEQTGRLLGMKKRFKSDKLQRNYESFAEQFGFTKRQVKDAMLYLDNLGVIIRDFRTITTEQGQKLSNVLFIGLDADRLTALTFGGGESAVSSSDHTANVTPMTFERHTSDVSTVPPLTFERQTNTEITTKITTDKEAGGERSAQEVIGPPSKKADPYKFYTENIALSMPSVIIEDMDQWIASKYFDEPEEIIVEAIKETILNGAKSWKYTTKILIGWADQGIRTLRQAQAAIAEHERNKTSSFSNGRRSGSARVQQANRTAADQAQVDKLRGVQAVETDPNYDPNQDLELQQLMSQLQSKGDGEP